LDVYDPITHEAITVTNDTYINQEVFCEFLEKIATAYADSERPITLILDNARYQKCQSVANKAKELNIELLFILKIRKHDRVEYILGSFQYLMITLWRITVFCPVWRSIDVVNHGVCVQRRATIQMP
jgi:hypothetical protein